MATLDHALGHELDLLRAPESGLDHPRIRVQPIYTTLELVPHPPQSLLSLLAPLKASCALPLLLENLRSWHTTPCIPILLHPPPVPLGGLDHLDHEHHPLYLPDLLWMADHVMSQHVHCLRDVPKVSRDPTIADLDTGRQAVVWLAVIRARHSNGAPPHGLRVHVPPPIADFLLLPGIHITLSAGLVALADVRRVQGHPRDRGLIVDDDLLRLI